MRVNIGWVLEILALGSLGVGLAGCPQVGLQCANTDVVCEETCANIHSDPLHCGSCSTQCPTGFSCTEGVCGCPFGLTECGQSCVSLQDSSNNCGSCGNACTGVSYCQQGSCVDSCSPGMTVCGQSCVDPLTDDTLCGCGIDGGGGTLCSAGTTCRSGSCRSDLFAACYQSGAVVGIDAVDEILSPTPTTNPPLNPSAMALNGSGLLEVSDAETSELDTFTLSTEPVTPLGLVSESPIGVDPSSVTMAGNLAFVINSSDATLDVIDLTQPDAGRRVCSTGGGAASLPDGGCTATAAFTPGSYPEFAAVASDAVYVSIQGDTTAEDGGPGNEIARVDLSNYSVTYTAITGDLQATGTQARPSGVAIANGQLYVALQNLNGFTASGPGLVDVFQLTPTADGGTSLGAQQIISLGPGCLNAGGLLQVGSILFVTCGPQYALNAMTGAYYPAVAGALAGVNLTNNQAAFQPQVLDCATSGGSCVSGGPTQLAYAGGTLFLADSIQARLFTANPTTGQIIRGPENPLSLSSVCAGPASGAGDFISAVVGIP